MKSLVFGGSTFDDLRVRLLSDSREQGALLICGEASDASRFVVRETLFLDDSAFSYRTNVGVEIKPETYVPIIRRAASEGSAVGFVHTHPFVESPPTFSALDDKGEQALKLFLDHRFPSTRCVALVISAGGSRARELGTQNVVQVYQVGSRVQRFDNLFLGTYDERRFDRQIRAFGIDGQRVLSNVKVGVVGLGGTGSAVVQQLAYLGIRSFILFDHDSVEQTNLNRLVGATPKDIGLPKIAVAERVIKDIAPEAHVVSSKSNILQRSSSVQLLSCDAIFSCTDSHGSRALLNQIAYQYYIPCFDVGTVISTDRGEVTQIVGRIQLLSPGLGCLTCANILDSDAVRRDFLDEEQLKTDPYFAGKGQPQPAVISINSTLSSLLVTMFLGVFIDVPIIPRFQIYDGVRGTVRAITLNQQANCITCSLRGSLGRGDAWELPARAG